MEESLAAKGQTLQRDPRQTVAPNPGAPVRATQAADPARVG